MTPTTKYQKHITKLVQDNLKPLSAVQKKWFISKSFWFYGVKHYSSLICLECAHKWQGSFGEKKTVKCPGCKKNLRDIEHHSAGYATRDSHGVLFDRIEDVAVLRIFFVRKHMRKGEESSYTIQEVVQKCFDPTNQKFTLFQRTLNGMMGNYGGGWAIGSPLSLRGHNAPTDYETQIHSGCLIYPDKKIPEYFLKAGFHFEKDDLINAYDKLMYILLDPRMETLYKYKESRLLSHFMQNRMTVKHWNALKIAFRRRYLVDPIGFTVSDWLDLVDLLVEFKKDTSSPHYVCPDDFHAMHSKMVKMKRKKQIEDAKRLEERRIEKQREDLIKQQEKALKDQERYVKLKEKYFGVVLEDNDLKIDVFKSVTQFMEEGDILGHCIFTNSYYNKENSLMLSAKVNGNVVETVELSLEEMTILQARGKGNRPTEYNVRIIKLVEDNIPSIIQLYQSGSLAS